MPQAAEVAHVDDAAHGVHHAAGRKEQQGLEERVREDVEDGRVGRPAQPRATNMNANWLMVEYARMRFMSYWAIAIVAASTAPITPSQTITVQGRQRVPEDRAATGDHVDARR